MIETIPYETHKKHHIEPKVSDIRLPSVKIVYTNAAIIVIYGNIFLIG